MRLKLTSPIAIIADKSPPSLFYLLPLPPTGQVFDIFEHSETLFLALSTRTFLYATS